MEVKGSKIMAFVNEFVENENLRTFETTSGKKVTPTIWTIDKKRDVILFWRREDREPPFNKYFVFYYKGYAMELTVHKTVIDPKIIKWRILSMKIPKKLKQKEVIAELKEAFIGYGFNGAPPFVRNNTGYVVELEWEVY